jgi:hypothetical protein
MTTNNKKRLAAASLMLATAALTSVALTSYAAAQCAECAIYQDRDPFTSGLATAPGKPAGAPAANRAASTHGVNNVNNAHAEMRGPHSHHAASTDTRTH